MLRNVLRRQWDQVVSNTQTSVSAEISGEPQWNEEQKVYEVEVEVPGGAYGGVSRFKAFYALHIPGLTTGTLHRGDIVLVSFDEKGYTMPRITAVLSLYSSHSNNENRRRGVVSEASPSDTHGIHFGWIFGALPSQITSR